MYGINARPNLNSLHFIGLSGVLDFWPKGLYTLRFEPFGSLPALLYFVRCRGLGPGFWVPHSGVLASNISSTVSYGVAVP